MEEKRRKWIGHGYFSLSHPSCTTCISLSPSSATVVCREEQYYQTMVGNFPLSSGIVSTWRITVMNMPDEGGDDNLCVGIIGVSGKATRGVLYFKESSTGCVWGCGDKAVVNGEDDRNTGWRGVWKNVMWELSPTILSLLFSLFPCLEITSPHTVPCQHILPPPERDIFTSIFVIKAPNSQWKCCSLFLTLFFLPMYLQHVVGSRWMVDDGWRKRGWLVLLWNERGHASHVLSALIRRQR